MADESLNFKFTLDLSDFDKAPKIIDDALHHIATEAEKQGKNADLAMSKYVQDMIKERENRVAELSKKIEEATKRYSEVFASFQNGQATAQQFDQASKALDQLKNELSQTKDELNLLNEKENEVVGNASFLTQLKMKAQGLDLYGKAMSMLPAPIANVIQSTKGLDKALKGLLANPVVLVIAGVVMAIKMLADYADMMANKFESWTWLFGTITEAVRKFKEVITAIITLDWKDFVYNLTNMFDGGAREIQRRNEKLAQSERLLENEKLRAEIQVLNKRASNRKRSFDERIKAQQEANAKELKLLENGLKDQEQAMREFYIDNNLYHPTWNPKGLKTSTEEIDLAQRSQLNELLAQRERLKAQIEVQKGINEENTYKLRQQQSDEWSKNIEAHRKREQYQRQVREALQAEAERLQAMSTQTENMVIQSQIKEMADGIEKVTKEAQFKTRQAYEALDKTLVDEAKKLYNNEKAIYEGNPANEGKMFKAFKLDDYVRQAKQNIGYDLRKNLISDEEIRQVKKAIDDIVKHALDGAKKVSVEIGDALRKVQQSASQNAPSFADTYESFSLGINDVKKATEEYKSVTDDLATAEDRLMELQMKRLGIMMELNHTEDGERKVELAEDLERIDSNINDELTKSENLLKKQATASEKVKSSFDKMKNNVSTVASAFGNAFSSLKGISKEMDETAESLGQMIDMATNMLNGDVMGAISQVATFIANKLADMIKSKKEMEKERLEKEKETLELQRDIMISLRDSALDYQLSMITAKRAQDALYNTTNINKMLDAQRELIELNEKYTEYVSNISSGTEEVRNRTGITGLPKNLASFVNGLKYNAGNARDPKNKQNINDIILNKYGSALFTTNQSGEYELNLELWRTLDDTAKKMFTSHQIKVIEGIADIQGKINEANTELAQSMSDWYSPLLDNMTDAMMDWLTTNEDIMDQFKDYSGDTFRAIVKDMLKNMLYKDLFDGYTDKIEQYTKDYLKTGDDKSYAQQIATVTDELITQLDGAKDTYKKVWDAWEESMNGIGIDMADSSRSAEARGIARASQESVDENNARLAMMQQHTYSINANVAQLVSFSASALEHLSAIHQNTNRLAKIESSLANIETYGIRTR